jgi:hypothetical protein
VLEKSDAARSRIRTCRTTAGSDLDALQFREIAQSTFQHTYKSIFDLSSSPSKDRIKAKMRRDSQRLGDSYHVCFGLKTGDDSVFLSRTAKNRDYKRLLRGEDVHRYSKRFKGEYVWYVPSQMTRHRRTARPGTPERFEQPKVLVRDTGGGLEAAWDDENYYVKDVLVVERDDRDVRRLKCLLGILNSRAMRFYYETSFPTLHVQRGELSSLPIPRLDASNPDQERKVNRMVDLVETILSLRQRCESARAPHEKTTIRRQIETADRQIDQLVYDLYGLDDEEIRIVEEATQAELG